MSSLKPTKKDLIYNFMEGDFLNKEFLDQAVAARYAGLKETMIKEEKEEEPKPKGIIEQALQYMASGFHKTAFFDENALLYAISHRLPLMQIIHREFGSRTKIAVTPYAIVELIKLSQHSQNRKLRNYASILLWIIYESKIPIKGHVKVPREELYTRLGRKSTVFLILHNKDLVEHMNSKKINTYHIHLFQSIIYKVSSYTGEEGIGKTTYYNEKNVEEFELDESEKKDHKKRK